MDFNSVLGIGSIIGGLLTGITALIVALTTKKRVKAEAADRITEAAQRLVELNQKELDRMVKKLDDMTEDVMGCHRKLDILEIEVKELTAENVRVKKMFELIYEQVKGLDMVPRCEPYWRDNT